VRLLSVSSSSPWCLLTPWFGIHHGDAEGTEDENPITPASGKARVDAEFSSRKRGTTGLSASSASGPGGNSCLDSSCCRVASTNVL